MSAVWDCERCGQRGVGIGAWRTHEFRCKRLAEMAEAGGPDEYVRKRLVAGADGVQS